MSKSPGSQCHAVFTAHTDYVAVALSLGHHTCESQLLASVTKQYHVAPAKGRLRSVAGKVTVGLASHWQAMCHRLSDISTYCLSGLSDGDEQPVHAHIMTTVLLCLFIGLLNVRSKANSTV